MANLAKEDKILMFPCQPKQPTQEARMENKGDTKDRFYKLAPLIVRKLQTFELSPRESNVFWSIFEKTIGFNEKTDWVSNNQLVKMTKKTKNNIWAAKKSLIDRRVLIVVGQESSHQQVGINLFIDEWVDKKRTKPHNKKDTESSTEFLGNEYGSSRNRVQKFSESSTEVLGNEYGSSRNRVQKFSESSTEVLGNEYGSSRNRVQKYSETRTTIEDTYTIDTFTKESNDTHENFFRLEQLFDAYPAHRKPGSFLTIRTLWLSNRLTEQDAINALQWLEQAKQQGDGWSDGQNGQYVFSMKNFITDRIWLTPVPVKQKSSEPDFHSDDLSWMEGLENDPFFRGFDK